MTDLHTALQALNKAAYAAYNAAKDAGMAPDEMKAIKAVMWATDRLVDDNAPGVKL